jgi:hypothetical protein
VTQQPPVDPEAIEAPEDHQPGISELSVISVLNSEWPTISVEQRGPDGTEVIGMVLFHACPLCNAVVPLPNPETGHHFPHVHAMFHVKQARDFDVLNRVLQAAAAAEADGS